MKQLSIDISVIIPVYNEEKNISLLVERLTNVMQSLGVQYELIFVNDGSHDQTLSIAKTHIVKDEHIKFIDFSRNFGHQIAVMAGLEKAAGKAMVIIDADLQDPPELITEMYQKYLEGNEVVYAKRKSRKGESAFKKGTAALFYQVLKRITSINIPVDTGDFRIIDHKIVDVLKEMPEHHKFLRGQISWIGFNQTFVEYERDERHGGESGYPLKKMVQFAFDGITSFSNFPLRMATLMGFIVSGITFLILIYALYSRLIIRDYEPGWASLIISVLFIGGIQLISIGLIGEYISRINTEVKRRPHYVIRDTNIPPKD